MHCTVLHRSTATRNQLLACEIPPNFKYQPVYLEPMRAKRLHCPVISSEESLNRPPKVPQKGLVQKNGNTKSSAVPSTNPKPDQLVTSKDSSRNSSRAPLVQKQPAYVNGISTAPSSTKVIPATHISVPTHSITQTLTPYTNTPNPKPKHNHTCLHCSKSYAHNTSLSRHVADKHQGVQLSQGNIVCSKCSAR